MTARHPRTRLRPGVRVTERAAGQLQVGSHDQSRVALPDTTPVRRLLALLGHGVSAGTLAPPERSVVERLQAADLLVPVDDATVRARLRSAARIGIHADDPVRAMLSRMVVAAGLTVAPGPGRESVRLVVVSGAEPQRERLDACMRDDLAHLVVTEVSGRVRLGPCVVPGLTACLRCVDEHLTDGDPRHPLVVAQHHDPDPADRVPEADRQLALAWAVRDTVALVEGDRPWTWSTTVELQHAGPVARRWSRHPRCGCAWGEMVSLTG